MVEAPFLSRQERFASVGSTNDVVRGWLSEGTPEVCLAVADEQTSGRGRSGRTWIAPAGAGLLLSLGFRPSWLPPERIWRLAATVSLAMADAAEEVAGLPEGAIRLKWPNDLVIELAERDEHDHEAADATPAVCKLAGVLGESEGLGSAEPTVVVGLGINTGWRAADFPPDLAGSMTSLHEASGGRPVDVALLLDAFLGRLEVRIEALRGGRFDLADWNARQVTTGRMVEIEWPDGSGAAVRAVGVDARSGGLVIANAEGGERIVHVGEVRHVRVPNAAAVEV